MSRFVIIGSIVLLAFAPVLPRYVVEHAIPRWYLAYGANELGRGKLESAKLALDKAYEQDSSIILDFHFVASRFDLLINDPTNQKESVAQFTQQLIDGYRPALFGETNQDKAAAGSETYRGSLGENDRTRMNRLLELVGSELLNRGYADDAVHLLQSLLPPVKQRATQQNNLLAYCRSVANRDLDQALIEINAAIRSDRQKGNYAFLDTKAWVLYRKGENQEALKCADRAIESFYDNLKGSKFPVLADVMVPDEVIENLLTEKFSAEPDGHGLEKEKQAIRDSLDALQPGLSSAVGELLQTIAVLRYHRMKILEAIGEYERAYSDRAWLELFEFEDESKLI